MATTRLFHDFEQFPFDDYAEDSRQLEDLRTADFSSLAGELKSVMPNAKQLLMQPVRLAGRVASDLARPYVRTPRRVITGLQSGALRALEDVYAEIGLDDLLLEVSQIEALQQQICIVPVPASGGRFRYCAFRPGDVVVEWDDPLERDLRFATQVTIRVPVSATAERMVTGRLVMTATEAWIESGDGRGERAGLFRAWGMGTNNPLGYIPIVTVRSVPPVAGFAWGALAQEVLAMNISIIVALTDLELVCRFQGHGRETLIGPGAKQAAAGMGTVRVGADVMYAFDEMEPNSLRHEITSPQPAIDRTIQAIRLGVEMIEFYRYIGGGRGSTAITGRGLEVAKIPEVEELYRVERRWRGGEQRLAELTSDVLQIQHPRLGRLSGRPKVQMDYQYVEVRENDLQSTQAAVLRAMSGRDSFGEMVARQENLSTADDGWALVKDRLVKNQEVLAGLASKNVPGIDSIAGSVGASGTGEVGLSSDQQGTAAGA